MTESKLLAVRLLSVTESKDRFVRFTHVNHPETSEAELREASPIVYNKVKDKILDISY